MDDTTREWDQMMMSVKKYGGGVLFAAVLTAKLSFKLLTYLMRLAKKGMVSAGACDRFTDFAKKAEGDFSVYNIPLAKDHAEAVGKLNALELELESASPLKKGRIRNEIKSLEEKIPELKQLDRLKISYCVLPKLNGSSQTIQVAVSKPDDQLFKGWFLNHLTTGLSGGEMGLEEMKVFTEGNYSIYNLPMEGEALKEVLGDFKILGINYSVLPDLNIGDGNTQVAVPNADRGKIEGWARMWRDQKVREGAEPGGSIYRMGEETYLNTGSLSAESYIAASEAKYREADREFEKEGIPVPQSPALGKENSEDFVRLSADDRFEKISINAQTLVSDMQPDTAAEQMRRSGFFISRVPGTYGESQQILILPSDHVFTADDGKTYIGFLPKDKKTMVSDRSGQVKGVDFSTAYAPYDRVQRGFTAVENYRKKMPAIKEKAPEVVPEVMQAAAQAIPMPKL